MRYQFANRASATLAAPVTIDSLSLSVAPGTGDRFPAPTGDAPIQLTVVSPTGASEVMQCTSRAGDTMQVQRGQEGSAVGAFQVGALVELRLTAATLDNFLQLGGGTMQGDLDTRGHTLYAENILGAPYVDYVKTHGAYPPDGNFTGAVELLNGGVHPRIFGNSILTTLLLQSAVFLWWGRLDQLPYWLKVCDGSLGTPNLVGRFVLGASGDVDIGEWGGSFDTPTSMAGAHNHGGATTHVEMGAFNLPGLTAPTLKSTTFGLLREAFAAGTADTFKQMVATVTMTGGGTYSGTAGHSHGVFGVGDHQHMANIRPPYFKLHFVMFRSMQVN
jgi:hypothetical protein